MIEFVGLSPILKNNINWLPWKQCIFTYPIPKCFEENFASHSEGPTKQFGVNLKGPSSAGYIVPQPLPYANRFYVICLYFLKFSCIYEYANEIIFI